MTTQHKVAHRAIEKRHVMGHAEGRWDYILGSLCPSLEDAINAGHRKHVGCPVHGGKDGFRFFKDWETTGGSTCNSCGQFSNGIDTIMFVNGWSFHETLMAIAEVLDLTDDSQDHQRKAPARKSYVQSEQAKRELKERNQKARQSLNMTWNAAVPLDAPEAEPVRLYLARRGLSIRYAVSSGFLRFHPSLPYYEAADNPKDPPVLIGTFPGMLALVCDFNGKPVTIHRTFLTVEGYKAPVRKAKKLMTYPKDEEASTIVGGAVPMVSVIPGNLKNGETGLAITEGIENALAIIEASNGRLPAWPAINALGLRKFIVPPGVDWIFAYGDLDLKTGVGEEAAAELLERVRVDGNGEGWIPSGEHGTDWLDVLNVGGKAAIPLPDNLALK